MNRFLRKLLGKQAASTPAKRQHFALQLEALEDRQLLTTAGWVQGMPPDTMTWASHLQQNLNPATSSLSISNLIVKDNVTRGVSFVAPSTGDYYINTAKSPTHTGMDTVLGVYDAQGHRLAANDDAPGSIYSALHVFLQAGQKYDVGVGHYEGAMRPDAVTRYCLLSVRRTSNPTITLNALSGVYNGSPFAATATIAGINGVPRSGLEGVSLVLDYQQDNGDDSFTDLGAQAPAAVGNYVVTASFAGSPHYAAASASAQFSITAPEIDNPLGGQLVQWLRDRIGQQIGDGQCGTTVDAALRAFNLPSFDSLGPTGADADYVWGNLVVEFHAGDDISLLDQIRPGDIIQFRDVHIHDEVPGGFFDYDFPHHTAMVAANQGGGTLNLLESNLNGDLTVAETVRQFADMTQGTIWIYRPVGA